MSDLTERLNRIWKDDHDRGCQGREYSCTCGFDEDVWKTAKEAADEIDQLTRELAEAERKLGEEITKAMHAEARATLRERSYQYARNDALEEAAKVADEEAGTLFYDAGAPARKVAARLRALKEKP